MKKSKSEDSRTRIRYDNCNHWVEFDTKSSRSRCKLNGCDGFTHAFCTKCKVHLCCFVNRNCFHTYHQSESRQKITKPVKQPNQITLKNRGSKQTIINKRSLYSGSNHIQNGTRTPKTTGQDTSSVHEHTRKAAKSSKITSVESTMESTQKELQKKVHWKPKLCEEFVYSGESSFESPTEKIGTAAKLYVVDLPSIQSTKRQDRRKTKHQVRAIGDEDIEFIEISD